LKNRCRFDRKSWIRLFANASWLAERIKSRGRAARTNRVEDADRLSALDDRESRAELLVAARSPAHGILFAIMDTVPVKPERLAQLEEFARRRGRSTADALDDVLADYLEWERQDYQEAVEGIRQGYEDVKAGRTKSADQFLDDFARKHGFPR
jgi:predicted transcriptional regulator